MNRDASTERMYGSLGVWRPFGGPGVQSRQRYSRRVTDTLRIELAGHRRWLAVDDDEPGFADLLADLRRHAPHATFREEADRRVMWRRHIIAGVVIALSSFRLESELVMPGEAALLQIGLSLALILLMVAPIAWTYKGPSRASAR